MCVVDIDTGESKQKDGRIEKYRQKRNKGMKNNKNYKCRKGVYIICIKKKISPFKYPLAALKEYRSGSRVLKTSQTVIRLLRIPLEMTLTSMKALMRVCKS